MSTHRHSMHAQRIDSLQRSNRRERQTITMGNEKKCIEKRKRANQLGCISCSHRSITTNNYIASNTATATQRLNERTNQSINKYAFIVWIVCIRLQKHGTPDRQTEPIGSSWLVLASSHTYTHIQCAVCFVDSVLSISQSVHFSHPSNDVHSAQAHPRTNFNLDRVSLIEVIFVPENCTDSSCRRFVVSHRHCRVTLAIRQCTESLGNEKKNAEYKFQRICCVICTHIPYSPRTKWKCLAEGEGEGIVAMSSSPQILTMNVNVCVVKSNFPIIIFTIRS